MAIDKSTWNKKVKVSQSTINDIKGLGMTKALNLAKMNAKSPQAGLVAEYQEATRRLYGDKRFSAATSAGAKKPSTSYSPAPKKASTKYSPVPMGTGPKKASTSYSPTPMKTVAKKPTFGGFSLAANKITGKNKSTAGPKKDNTKSNLLKGVAGTVAAVGVLALGRGKGAGIAAKLAPGLMKNKVAQAALTGQIKKTAAKATTKKVAPKAVAKTPVKTVSQSSYDTMVAAKRGQDAVAKGKAVTPEQFTAMGTTGRNSVGVGKKPIAKKAPAKKAAPKKTAPKKTGLSAGRRFDANAPKAKTPKAK